jgi:5,5'-dehydrodivanillate O-demethylase
VTVWENGWTDENGKYMPEMLNAQDMMVMITQGPITDHGLENLATSDRGVAMYRKTLLDQVGRVERGEDPLGVIRDPKKNEPFVEIPIERHTGYSMTGTRASQVYDFPDAAE